MAPPVSGSGPGRPVTRTRPRPFPPDCTPLAGGALTAGRTAAGRARRLDPLDEGEVGGLRRLRVALVAALLVVVGDGLLQLRELLVAAHRALRQLLPAPGQVLRLRARGVEVEVGPHLGEQG